MAQAVAQRVEIEQVLRQERSLVSDAWHRFTRNTNSLVGRYSPG